LTRTRPTRRQKKKGGSAASSLFALLLIAFQVTSGRKTALTWVNGIAHTVDHMEEGKEYISELFGGKPVLYCYNPTAMSHQEDTLGYITDLSQAGTQKLGYITAEVDSLVKHLKGSLAKVGPRGLVIHIAHSQGALITSLAAKKLAPHEMEQIEILAFGGAAAVTRTPQTPFRRCINYYSVNDPLLLVVPQAAQALRSGFAASHGEFCFLAPRMGDPVADHNLFGPTYAQALEWEGARFLRMYESSLIRFARRMLLLLSVFAEAISTYLKDRLKVIFRPIVVWCILVYLWTVSVAAWIRDASIVGVVRPTAQAVVSVRAFVQNVGQEREAEDFKKINEEKKNGILFGLPKLLVKTSSP
jgi:hypothetical protein